MTLARLKLRIYDLLMMNYRGIIGGGLYVAALFFYAVRNDSYFQKTALAAIRYSYSAKAQLLLKKAIFERKFPFNKFLSQVAKEDDACGRAIILSTPTCSNEKIVKGVILLTFSHTFSYFLQHANWATLNKHFVFILEPSWAGYSDHHPQTPLRYSHRPTHKVKQNVQSHYIGGH